MLNLAINARDAMPGGGNLIIETGNAVLDETYAATHDDVTAGNYVLLSVTDTGAGMTPEVLSHVFEPFYTTKDVGEGSGLGLSMVCGFAKQSGGHITIYSEPGKGTTVSLYLPRTRAEAESSKVAPEAEAPRGSGETVLVVEDDKDIRAIVAAMLEDTGYRVRDAPDGAAGLALLEETPDIDLLITDMVLPGGMSGRDLAAEAERALRRSQGPVHVRLQFRGGAAERLGGTGGQSAPQAVSQRRTRNESTRRPGPKARLGGSAGHRPQSASARSRNSRRSWPQNSSSS